MEDAGAPSTTTDALPELTLPPSFPEGKYTPHGYIDNPYHTMIKHPAGVIRSVPPLGFGFWQRTFKGACGTGPRGLLNYVSILKMTTACNGECLVSAADFPAANIDLHSRYHSRHMVSYDFEHKGLAHSFRFFLASEDALACLIEIASRNDEAKDVYIHANNVYGWWEVPWSGADGFCMRYVPERDAGLNATFSYGDCFALGSNVRSVAHKGSACREEIPRWLRGNDLTSRDTCVIEGSGPLHTIMTYRLHVPPGERATALVCLCRGKTESDALDKLEASLGEAVPLLEQQLDRDEEFWSRCPQLEGDWPAAWKTGWTYDWETLRMNIRQPAGVFTRPWYGDQVHSPRSVLGDTAISMRMLALADSALAQEVLLGTFADNPRPNVASCREDGSVNMIARDGSGCGSSPATGYPIHALQSLFAATHDTTWLEAIYPHAKTYVDWWVENRTDEQGGFFCRCCSETGLNGRERLSASDGDATAVRMADLEAAMASTFRIMAVLARFADAPLDVSHWGNLAEQYTAAARRMFVDGRFRDFDTRTGRPFESDAPGIATLAPLACGIASDEQLAAMRDTLATFRENLRDWSTDPRALLTFCDAAFATGQHTEAADITALIADRIYARLDEREVQFDEPEKRFAYRVPGVACETWPVSVDIPAGDETCAIGATLPLHIIRGIVGFRETGKLTPPEDEAEADIMFHLTPTLPSAMRTQGKRYTVNNLTFRDMNLSVQYDVADTDRLDVTLDYTLPGPGTLRILDDADNEAASAKTEDGTGTITFESRNATRWTVRAETRGRAGISPTNP